MKIAVLDDNKIFLSYIKMQLNKIGFKDIHLFEDEDNFFKWIYENKDVDLIFIDYHLKKLNGFEILQKIKKDFPYTYKIMITSDEDNLLREKALILGYDYFINKQIDLINLQALLNTVKKLISFIKKELKEKEELKQMLQFKQKQEKIIKQKQNKIMQNELEMYFDKNFLFETYFAPKDLLTGDTIFTKKLNEHSYFISVIDAMGKGLEASLTSFNALAFLKHSLKKAIEYKDFNFNKLVKDFVEYTKTTLLNNEILCASLIYIEKETVLYACFGNPPLLTSSKIVKTNNHPIQTSTQKIQIDSFKIEDKLLIASDGLFEAFYQNTLYFKRLKELFPKILFLKELTEDLKKSKIHDDVSIVYITKEKHDYQLIKEFEFKLDIKGIDTFLEQLLNTDIPRVEKIHFILHELLTNTYEHNILKIKNKEKLKKEKLSINFKVNTSLKAKVKIFKNDKCIKIIYEDTTKGFEIQKIKDAYYNKYHGRGIKIIKHLADGLFFNENGTLIKIFIKV